jgi:DNA polymerase elongation subunit (family B)
MFEKKSILVYDIECSSLDTSKAKIKWFGAYSYANNSYYLLPFIGNEKEIIALLKEHRVLVGFNNKQFDNEILKNNFNDEHLLDYRVIVDLYEISASKSGKDYGRFNKNRLAQMGIKLKSFTLKNIVEVLKLDKDIGTKGNIDYKIFQRDEWLPSEIIEIKKYLQQDIDITKKLFEWYQDQFSPLMKFLPTKDQDNFLHLKSSLSVLAYNIICNKANLKAEYGEKTNTQSFSGGHHIENRWNLVKGKIYNIDVQSCYPHCIMMGNLCSPVDEREEPSVGWRGDDFFHIEGRYYNHEQGKIENALKYIFLERLKAKREKDDAKNKSYKIIINSFFGITGNPVFKSVYNHNTASDCTSMARTILKKLSKTLEVNGFSILGGFTDNVFVLVPSHLTKKHLMFIVDEFIKEALRHVPFPMKDTFKMEVEAEIKMIWFVAKNCYLFVTKDNKVEYKSTLLNTNTPKAVMKLFEEYMKPIIIENLDIPFTKKELELKMREILEKEPDLSAQEYKVGELGDYKVKTSLQYQISEKYGTGRHFLIPNKANIGVGLAKHSKKNRAIRHCTIEEFKSNELKISDIDLTHLLSHLKPFYERNEKHEQEKKIGIQQTLM